MTEPRKKSGVVFWATVVVLPVLYVASFGPACWISSREIAGMRRLAVYRPLTWSMYRSERIGIALGWGATGATHNRAGRKSLAISHFRRVQSWVAPYLSTPIGVEVPRSLRIQEVLMGSFDALYARLLTVGFVVMRQAIDSGDRSWVDAEIELLHNVPSLIGESNLERHKYFWHQERPQYIEWASGPRRQHARARMLTYYKPIWDEMEQLGARLRLF